MFCASRANKNDKPAVDSKPTNPTANESPHTPIEKEPSPELGLSPVPAPDLPGKQATVETVADDEVDGGSESISEGWIEPEIPGTLDMAEPEEEEDWDLLEADDSY